MWHDPTRKYHPKLHYCQQGNHYHIILGPENISWPFWSLEGGLALLDFTEGMFLGEFAEKAIDAARFEFNTRELGRLREEILAMSKIQKIGPDGRSIPGKFQMPRHLRRQEETAAIFWGAFMQGLSPYIGCDIIKGGEPFFVPLYCDFIHREEGPPEKALDFQEWAMLAMRPVTRVTMEELGILLDPAE